MTRKKSGRPTGRGSGGVTHNPPVYVSIYCTGDTSAHDKWMIASVVPEVSGSNIVWHVSPRAYHDPTASAAQRTAVTVAQWLVGDQWLSHEDAPREVFNDPRFRVRWNLECGICHLKRTIATPAELYPALTTLAQLQIREVELNHLVHANR